MKISEVERFWSHVVKGPDDDDCWLWTGAISDDGYGRFWTRTSDGQKAVRPQRYAYAITTGRAIPSSTLLLHSCDIPICVHVDEDPFRSHLSEGTHRENMLDRAQKGRHENQWTLLRYQGVARDERARRSRALRAVILENGWSRERMSAALAGIDEAHPLLF